MTFNDLVCLNKNEKPTIDSCISMDKVYVAKEIFQEHMPTYVIETMSGEKVILTDHFSKAVVIALSTDSMEIMGKREKSLFRDFIKYEDFLYSNGTTENNYVNKIEQVIAVDTWLYNEVMKIKNDSLNDDTTCGNNLLDVCNLK